MRGYVTSKALRAQAAEEGVYIRQMEHQQCERAARYGWDDPMIDEIEVDVLAAKTRRAKWIAQANEYKHAA